MPQHQKWWSKLQHPLFITIVSCIVVILLILGLLKNIRQLLNAHREINQIKTEIDNLDKKNTEISYLISYLQSKEFLEEQARLNFGLQKPNEQIIVVKQSATDTTTNLVNSQVFDLPAPPQPKLTVSANPKKWFDYFFAPQ